MLDSEGDDAKPRLRTREEIIAKYRKAGVVIFVGVRTFSFPTVSNKCSHCLFNHYIFQDASSAAGEARNKLLERQEKLEVFKMVKIHICNTKY